PRTCTTPLPAVRATTAIDPNVVTRASEIPLCDRESNSESRAGEKGFEESKVKSPPISARDWSFTDWMMLAENESMATSAATPSEIDDMYSNSRRRAVLLSRQARLQTLRERPITPGPRSTRWCLQRLRHRAACSS